MTRLLFTNLTMLAGLAALAIPILIHLLLKRRKQRLRFSTLQFFLQQDEHSSQRRKLRNFLLLAVRLLLLAVLVLAFARPYLAGSNVAGTRQQRRLAVFVVDRSASLQASDAGLPRWPRVQEAIQKVLAELTPNDRAALISCASHGEVLSGAAPPEVLARLVRELQPTCGRGQVGEGLQLAGKIVSRAGRESVSTIYLLSDLQLSSCKNLAAYPVPPEVEVKPIQIGDVVAPNLAVTELQLEGRAAGGPHVVLANFSDEKPGAVNINLVIDGQEALARAVTLATGTVTRADLALPALLPGWHSGVLRLAGEDALALDNVRYEAFYVPQPLRALVVETRPGKRVFEEESFFVTSALDPMPDATNAHVSRFAVEKVSPEELLKKLPAPAERPSYDLVIVPGLKQIPSGWSRALAEFVHAGGGLLLFLGDDLNASRYNSEFRDFLPALLGHVERNPAESAEQKWHLEEYDLQAPMLAVFRRPNSGNLALPEFTRRFTVTTNELSVVSARFGDGVPALMSMAVGQGRVALINTSADTAWTDWPKHKTFVPWLHSLGLYLAGRSGVDQTRTAARLVAADDHEVLLGATARQKLFRVQRLGEKENLVTADDEGRLPNVDFGVPGIYSIRDRAGQEVQRLAVNLPAEESDLTAHTPAELQRELARTQESTGATAAAGVLGAKDQPQDFARWLLMVGLGLLFVETFLANRTFA